MIVERCGRHLAGFAAGAVVLAVAALAGCGGGGGSTTLPTSAGAAAAPTVAPAFSGSQTSSVSVGAGAVPSPIALPSAGGYGGVVTLPAAVAAASAQVQTVLSSQLPNGVAPLDLRHLAQVARTAQGTRFPQGVSFAPVLYIQMLASSVIQLQGSPSFSLVIPSASVQAGVQYFVSFYYTDQGAWNLAFEGPAALGASTSGTTLTFTPSNVQFTFQAGATYEFALIAVAPGSATPTPGPTLTATPTPAGQTPTPIPTGPTPSPVPTAAPTVLPIASPTPLPSGAPTPSVSLIVSPSTLALNGLGAAAAETVTLSEPGYTGAISEQDNCSGITTLSPPSASGPQATFTFTPVNVGVCLALFTDTLGQGQYVSLTVNTIGLSISSTARR